MSWSLHVLTDCLALIRVSWKSKIWLHLAFSKWNDSPAPSESQIHDTHPIFQAGEGQWGTDESSINQVLATRNYFQLNETFAAYEKLTGHSIMEAVKKETSGSLQKGFLAVSKYLINNFPICSDHIYRKKQTHTYTQELVRFHLTSVKYVTHFQMMAQTLFIKIQLQNYDTIFNW